MAEFALIGPKWPRGTRLRVKDELMGGSLLETLPELQEPSGESFKVKVTPEAFQALLGLRKRGESASQAMQRLIFAAEAGHPLPCQTNLAQGSTDYPAAPTPADG